MTADGVLIQNTDINVMNTLLSFHCNVQDVPYDSTAYEPHPLNGIDDHTNAYTYGNIIVFFVNLLLDMPVIK